MGDHLHDVSGHSGVRGEQTAAAAAPQGTVLQLPRKTLPADSREVTATLAQVRRAAVSLVAAESDWVPDRYRADCGRLFLAILDGGIVPDSALPLAAQPGAGERGCGGDGCIDHYPAKPAGCICPAWRDSDGLHLAARNVLCDAHETKVPGRVAPTLGPRTRAPG
jgi:hypothetical protein